MPTMNDFPKIAVLIPAYNEQKTIKHIVNRCLSYTSHVMVIDDGSSDATLSIVKNTNAEVFSNTMNMGKGATLLKGFQLAIERGYDGVIALDADGQHNPDDLPRFLSVVQQTPTGLIIGARRINVKNAPRVRLLANKMADFFISLAARKRLFDTQSGYRYYPGQFLQKYLANPLKSNRFAFEAEILISAVSEKLPIHYVDIQSCYPTNARASHYRSGKDTWQIAKAITKLIFQKRGSHGNIKGDF